MRAFLYITLFLIAGLPFTSLGQPDAGNPIEKRAFYRTMNMYGGEVHTRGLGAYYRRGWRQTGFSNKIYHVELLSVNHPKQEKVEPLDQQYLRYYEGKINSVFFLRNSFGWQKTMYDKVVKRGVRVSYFFLFGPTLGIAKPIYMNVSYNNSSGNSKSTERYNYEKHTGEAQILGRAPFLLGTSEIDIYPGIHTKFAFNFEYSGDDENIKAIETGITFDAFAKEIPIMAITYNDQFYLTFYIALHLGKRYL
jgi:hypothetical protein